MTPRCSQYVGKKVELTEAETDRVIEMAWEDRTPFGAISVQFGLDESAVIELMRRELSPSGFKRWRKRVSGRKTKHRGLRMHGEMRFKSRMQRQITRNAPSKPK
jgi:uncharacterized protein (TIGR03643 family)